MAALNIAFDSPETALGHRHSRGRPIDLVHLANQTMGDKALEIEVLQIFARQSRQIVKELLADEVEVRKAAAHRLKGAALAVGAFTVAHVAASVEDHPEDSETLASLSSAVLDTEIFILKLCR
ncbi:Hpt domain-containing protein [Rhizobium sp. DKSPLA3]|uniref:Hpt domain-containing protein n=1 Tax=Rhizobium quercicola TaxID=2901226 RepID=A0A9X1T0S6_9HYPH|nr:Hpt domain-containing protein [Rhizobium quercicola]MCD7109856.1 Hpt domain-containing protein [Rhizobium quercicola]